ncbi:hypothetical protein H9Q69_006471 [Fusarium xylarioides]|uniref:Uncharacterized protein n=1 Tax=Fusarium xylarioides TaxID=221167 RepID=A0A9P7IUL9_9HYPO|nr:hypothetical protein H9Q70_007161 [Fusarium xylarioides]KAG5762341.1 hypothetical protein H9Q72_009558 [Fusarium xylarioides]KAG5779777.1 hypothetical protein H9Q73_006551 [Fusarium xylarioides]KAG5794469.1 hypothetical protein H9Q69_006471 [Fusarium xylarioides]KAG5817747.1 hypothetical protein H9Q71_001747 [Fusarium xylarioides]
MSGDSNSTAFLDNNDLIGSGSGAPGAPGVRTMARIDFILDNKYSHVMIVFAVLAALAALVSIAIIFTVVRSFSKVRACMPPPGDDNGHGLNMYGSYRKTQVHFIFIVVFLLGCLASFTLATAKLMLLGKIEGSVDLLSIAFSVQALTLLSALLASRSLMENTLTIFMEEEADMEINEWDPKL